MTAATGADKQRAARYVVTARTLAALVLIELLAHLASAGARLIGRAIKRKPKRSAKPKTVKQSQPAESAGNVVLISRPSGASATSPVSINYGASGPRGRAFSYQAPRSTQLMRS